MCSLLSNGIWFLRFLGSFDQKIKLVMVCYLPEVRCFLSTSDPWKLKGKQCRPPKAMTPSTTSPDKVKHGFVCSFCVTGETVSQPMQESVG